MRGIEASQQMETAAPLACLLYHPPRGKDESRRIPDVTREVVGMANDLRDPWLEIKYHDRERIAEMLIELNNRACAAETALERSELDT
jgi:hypothetical protein